MLMASWRSSQDRGRVRDSQDIRKFIRVHGRIIPSSIQTDSTEPADGDSIDDFSTPHTISVVRPTKQLTLMHFNKKLSHSNSSKDNTQREGGETESVCQLFFPASKFSTGVRRKAREDEMNKENRPTHEGGSRMTNGQPQSPMKRVQHRSPSSVGKKRREKQQHPISSPKHDGRKRGQKTNEVTIGSQEDGFLSSRKKTSKYCGPVSLEATGQGEVVSATLIPPTACKWNGVISAGKKPEVTEESSKVESLRGKGCLTHSVTDSDSDVYINTDELLEELSNCEKSLMNAHRS